MIESRARTEERSQLYASIVAIVIGVGSMVLIGLGHSAEGVTALVAELTALAGVFIYGRKKQEQENVKKQQG